MRLLCMSLCMATRTLSVDEEAYRRLAKARRHAKESFSQVIKRASWDAGRPRCGDLVKRSEGLPLMSEDALNQLEEAKRLDASPVDKWNL